MTATAGAAAPVARVALVGLPGAGKSAVGSRLAARRGWRFVDLDEAVASAAGRPVPELVAEDEPGFREREAEALAAVLAAPGPVVVATGGGAVTSPRVRELLRSCTVAWLDAADPVLRERVGAATDRPLLATDPGARLATLRDERAPLYAAAAQVRVDTSDGDADDACDLLEDAVAGSRLGLPAAASGAATVTVALGERAYTVRIGSGLVADVGDALPASARRVVVVADRAVLATARQVLSSVRRRGRWGRIVAVRGGEQLKTWARAGRLVTECAEARLERGDCVVAVGGGTVGDVAGFAAATYLRGIAVVHVPTTLLAMVDSAVGGKTGVNLRSGKNLAGAFWQPTAVLCDLDVLRTLGRRPWNAALAEVVKCAMVDPDPEPAAHLGRAFDALLARDPAAVAETVRHCTAFKARIVAADEREAGLRAVLNYGHTAAHAVEAVTAYRLLHGEAVGVGLRVAGALSRAVTGCPDDDVRWQDDLLARAGLGRAGETVDPGAVLVRTATDKKARGGEARWVLLERRGAARPGVAVPEASALAALAEVLL